MRTARILFTAVALIFGHGSVAAKMDLVTLPKREKVQLTIYNSADLTLVRERRALTLEKGLNRLEFSWANTLIDPTSLDMLPMEGVDSIDVLELSFPPRVDNLGQWRVRSAVSGMVPVEISYLTSGLSWRAFYMGILSEKEQSMRLQGYVRVTNSSGEDYDNAQVRVIVGKVGIIDRIADLARRKHPYGRPGPVPMPLAAKAGRIAEMDGVKQEMMKTARSLAHRPKEIKKEGLSEYFLYTIEGKETIPNGWSKRLPSFSVEKVPVVNLYKYDEERFGKKAVRVLSFRNDRTHDLGRTPIPGGMLKLFREKGVGGQLTYEGQSRFKYIPMDEDIELNLGVAENVIIRPVLMDYKTDHYLFDQDGRISGWDEVRVFEVTMKNTREIPVKVEVRRHFQGASWEIEKSGDFGEFEKVDLDTVRFTLTLQARETKRFHYTLRSRHGQRAD